MNLDDFDHTLALARESLLRLPEALQPMRRSP
jgi:hypothetical protein